MSLYFDILPLEINQAIYREIFKLSLKKIKQINSCCMCQKIVTNYNGLKIDSSYCKCVSCGEAICFKCWSSYYVNSGGGWKSFFGYCNNCAIKIDTV